MAVVDAAYYRDEYRGEEVDPSSFAALEARAEDAVLSACRLTGEGLDGLSSAVTACLKRAVCVQMDSMALYGDEALLSPGSVSFSVGRVSVSPHGAAGRLAPLAEACLEGAGLLYRGVGAL